MLTVVGGYLATALVVTVAPGLARMPRWLALHLLFLGAASNAIVFYGAHFAETLLHARPTSSAASRAQLALLNAGVLAVLTGVDGSFPIAVAVGAGIVAAVVTVHVARLLRLVRRSLAGRLRATPGFYIAGGMFLLAGATSGSLLGTGATTSGRLVVVHAEVNLFGWVGLTVLGTLFMLWPAALRVRMAEHAPRVARRTLVMCATGLAVSAAALLAGSSTVAAGGMTIYAAGVAWSAEPLLRVSRRPHDIASASLAAATVWLLAGAGWLAAELAGDPAHVDTLADWLAPTLAVGLVAQVLVGALSFLLPVLLGGGPAGSKRMTRTLDRGWRTRAVLPNVGLAAATATSATSPLQTVGHVAAFVGLGAFLPLALTASREAAATTTGPGARGLAVTSTGPSQ